MASEKKIEITRNKDLVGILPGVAVSLYDSEGEEIAAAVGGRNLSSRVLSSNKGSEGDEEEGTARNKLYPHGPNLLYFSKFSFREKNMFGYVHPILMDKIALIVADGFSGLSPAEKDSLSVQRVIAYSCGIIRVLNDHCYRTQKNISDILFLDDKCKHFEMALRWLSRGGTKNKPEKPTSEAEGGKQSELTLAGEAEKQLEPERADKATAGSKRKSKGKGTATGKATGKKAKKSKSTELYKHKKLVRCYTEKSGVCEDLYQLNMSYVKRLFERNGYQHIPEFTHAQLEECEELLDARTEPTESTE